MSEDNFAAEQYDLSKLPKGDHACWRCTVGKCAVTTQGGRAGHDCHLLVVHQIHSAEKRALKGEPA